jgi:hypothetical protein
VPNRLHLLLLAVSLAAVLFGGRPAQGQDVRPDSAAYGAAALTAPAVPPRVTLADWAATRRLWVLDRVHAYGDQFYDRGVFRHITPRMDREYAIDLSTYRYTLGQDHAWHQRDGGLRLRTGSITRNQWGIVTQLKQTVEVAEGHALRFDALLQEDAQAERGLLEINYTWALTAAHHVGARHTFAQYKPDFDVSVFYRYDAPRYGRVRAEVTALDAYNDFLFETLGVWKGEERYERIYEQNPFLLQLSAASPSRHPLRAEVYAGWQPASELTVQSQFADSVRYRDRESLHYLGALLAYDLGPVSTGLVYQRDQSSLDRRGLRSGVTSDYRTEQRYERIGLFSTGTWGPFRGSAWVFLEEYYDRQRGSDFQFSTIDRPLDWTEARTNVQLRIYYAPESTGVFAGLEYIAIDRRPDDPSGVMRRQWATNWAGRGVSHYRGPVILGYRFGKGAVSMGINYDFDGDRKGDRFDNGFFRFSIGW